MPNTFEIIIVHGVNKPLTVAEDERIDEVKVRAMGLYEIPPSDKDKYILRAKEKDLPGGDTVRQADLHPHEKVTLAAASPYGR